MDYFIVLLTLQDLAGIISLIGTLIVVFVVIFLMFTSRKSEDGTSVKQKVYSVRKRYFIGLTLLLVLLLIFSLRLLPYPNFQQNKAEETVTVVGVQWAWKMAHGISEKRPEEFSGKNEITLPVNKWIRFIVTSADVNHGLGIYDSRGDLLTQVQAMPGYDNELLYEFKEEGDYTVVCMEYCGLAHGVMVGTIHIQ